MSYGTEEGSGPTNDDPFTFRNGTDTYSIAARYTVDNLTVSAGYTYTNTGDVKIIHEAAPGVPSGLTASSNYTDNNVSGLE